VATQAVKVSKSYDNTDYEQSFYPQFSSRWCFSLKGKLTNKGAMKGLQDKMDDKLSLRQQYREKHGLCPRMSPFTSLSADQIGDESILRSIIKMTAPCWTRCLYHYPPLANQIWQRWQDFQKDRAHYQTLPINVPKKSQKAVLGLSSAAQLSPKCTNIFCATTR